MKTSSFILAAMAALLAMAVFLARVGMPNLVGSGQAFAGTHAVSTLSTLHWAEQLFREGSYDDVDRDGSGEFGSLDELAARTPAEKPLSASLLEAPGETFEAGLMSQGGYCYRIDLPPSTDERERHFVAYAWPDKLGAVGDRLFCIDQDARILEADAGPHVGCDRGPPPGTCPAGGSVPADFRVWKKAR